MSILISHHSGISNSIDSTDISTASVFLKYRAVIISLACLSISIFAVGFYSFSIFVFFLLCGIIGMALSSIHGYIGIKIFSLVYSTSTLFAIIFYFIFQIEFGIPYGGGGSDSLAYEKYAAIVAKSSLIYNADEIGQAIGHPYHNSKGYLYFVSILIRYSDLLGGFHTMIPRLFNSCLLGVSSGLVYGISRKIGMRPQLALNSALVTGLFPIMIFVAVQPLRDIPILVLMLLSVYLAIGFVQTRSVLKQFYILVSFVPLSLIIMELRLLNMINIGIVLGVALFVKLFSVKKISNFYVFFTIVIVFVAHALIKTTELGFFIDLVAKLDSSANDLAEGVDRTGEGGLSLILFNLPTPLNYFGSLFYSFITPLPILYTTDFAWNFLSIGTIYQFLFIPFVFAGIKCSYRSAIMLPVFFIFLVSYVGYVFGSFTFRHIVYFVPFAAIYGVIGYEIYKKKSWIRPLFSVILVFLLLAYYAIKFFSA
jgi:hypothetical protein